MVPYIQLAINFTSGLQQCPHVDIKFAMSPIFIITFMVTTKMLVSSYWDMYLGQLFKRIQREP